MNNTIWAEFIERLYNGFHNTTEVMSLVGYRKTAENGGEDVVEYVEYYTSHDEATVVGNFRDILKAMSKYTMLRGTDARFVLVHNHPAGTPDPSDSDRAMTERFQVACAMLGVTCMGSYIYIEGGDTVLIGGLTGELETQRIRISNQYNPSGAVSIPRLAVQRLQDNVNEHFRTRGIYDAPLSEPAVDAVLQHISYEPYGLVELDDNNSVKAIYELNKLQPNIPNRVALLELQYQKGMAMVFMRDASRFVVYDKRENIERDGRGLATDTKQFIQAMGIVGYPVNFYVG